MNMSNEDVETLWLYFNLAHVAALKGDYEDAQSNAQKALDMIDTCCAHKKQCQMAVETVAHRDQRKAS